MQVFGTALQDLTNTSEQRQWQASALLHKGREDTHAGPSVLAMGATDIADSKSTVSANLDASDLESPSVSGSLDKRQSAYEQRQARRLHRKRVARIVVDQWRWFTRDRLKMQPALRHHNHRLMLSALLALQRHSAHRQLEWRRAAIFNHRRQYLIQGRCLLLWHAQLDYSKKVQLKLDSARLTRRMRQQRTCLKAWQQYRDYKSGRRKQHLQASFYRSFVLLSSALQQWRSWSAVSAVKGAKHRKALTFWASKQYAKAISSWALGVADRRHLRQLKEQAFSTHKRQTIARVLVHWQEAALEMQNARQAGSEALQVRFFASVCPQLM